MVSLRGTVSSGTLRSLAEKWTSPQPLAPFYEIFHRPYTSPSFSMVATSDLTASTLF